MPGNAIDEADDILSDANLKIKDIVEAQNAIIGRLVKEVKALQKRVKERDDLIFELMEGEV